MVIRPPRRFMLDIALGACLLGLGVPSASAQSFAGLGKFPEAAASNAYAISADGSVVVGSSGNIAFFWTSSAGMIGLGTLPGGTTSEALGVNADGTAIVGYAVTPEGVRAFRWTDLHGMVALSTPTSPNSSSSAYDLGSDGLLAVGSGFTSAGGFQAYRWTNLASGGGTRTTLPFLTTQTTAFARAASTDGAVIVGFCGRINGNFNDRACRWTGAGVVDLGFLPGGTRAQASGVNPDGSVIVGTSDTPDGDRAFRWTAAGGMISLGAIETDASASSSAAALSADGSVVVGSASFASATHAFMWTQPLGMVDLNTYLPTIGIDLTGWVLLSTTGVSADGLTLVGQGYHDGGREAWIAYLYRPCPCAADFNCDTIVNSADFFDFLASFFADAPAADFNHDAAINSSDFFDFLSAFFGPCG